MGSARGSRSSVRGSSKMDLDKEFRYAMARDQEIFVSQESVYPISTHEGDTSPPQSR